MKKHELEQEINELHEANESLAEGVDIEAALAAAHKKTADRYFQLLCNFVFQFTENLNVVAEGLRTMERIYKKCDNPYGISNVELLAIARINGGIEPFGFIRNPEFSKLIDESSCTPTFIYELDNFGRYDNEKNEFIIDKTTEDYQQYKKRFDVYTIVYYLSAYPQRYDALYEKIDTIGGMYE